MNKYFNRLEYGRRLLAEPVKNRYSREEIQAMLGFLITAMGQTPIVAKNMVVEKLQLTNRTLSEKKLNERVHGICKEIVANGYDDVAPIKILQSEVDSILTAKTVLQQKLLFVYLCHLKYQQNLTGNVDDFYVNVPRGLIHEGMGRRLKNDLINQTIFELRCQGLMCNKQGINETKGVLVSNFASETAFEVDDLRNLAAVWVAHTNKSYMRHKVLKKCGCCGAPFLDSTTKNNALYCGECRKLPQYKRKLSFKS